VRERILVVVGGEVVDTIDLAELGDPLTSTAASSDLLSRVRVALATARRAGKRGATRGG
jgi:hypothetical protein